MVHSPTASFAGSLLGPPMYVLTRSEIRQAEAIDSTQRFSTRDGTVVARPGDVAITAYGGERYPVLKEVFFGAYEILSRVGSDIVARRLIHVRRAWEVLGDGATYDYGPGRGKVPIARGSWLYQSDEEDFGTIHPDVKRSGHVEVGVQYSADAVDWRARAALLTACLNALPPMLTALALAAFFAAMLKTPEWVSLSLMALELAFLVGGAISVVVMRRQRWLLKCCVQSALELGSEFQDAIRMLGHSTSELFSGMALWRAAQTQSAIAPQAEALESLNAVIASRLHSLDDDVARAHRQELVSAWITLASFVIVLGSNLWLLKEGHGLMLEFAVIWLPSLIAAIHGSSLRRRTAERISAMRAFSDQLRFAQARLLEHDSTSSSLRAAALQLVCRCAAHYSQQELRIAMSVEPALPI